MGPQAIACGDNFVQPYPSKIFLLQWGRRQSPAEICNPQT